MDQTQVKFLFTRAFNLRKIKNDGTYELYGLQKTAPEIYYAFRGRCWATLCYRTAVSHLGFSSRLLKKSISWFLNSIY